MPFPHHPFCVLCWQGFVHEPIEGIYGSSYGSEIQSVSWLMEHTTVKTMSFLLCRLERKIKQGLAPSLEFQMIHVSPRCILKAIVKPAYQHILYQFSYQFHTVEKVLSMKTWTYLCMKSCAVYFNSFQTFQKNLIDHGLKNMPPLKRGIYIWGLEILWIEAFNSWFSSNISSQFLLPPQLQKPVHYFCKGLPCFMRTTVVVVSWIRPSGTTRATATIRSSFLNFMWNFLAPDSCTCRSVSPLVAACSHQTTIHLHCLFSLGQPCLSSWALNLWPKSERLDLWTLGKINEHGSSIPTLMDEVLTLP